MKEWPFLRESGAPCARIGTPRSSSGLAQTNKETNAKLTNNNIFFIHYLINNYQLTTGVAKIQTYSQTSK